MRSLPDASIDSIVTDPPYHLTNNGGGPSQANDSAYSRSRAGASRSGFMGMTWDGGDTAFQVATWAECLRVLKPGGHLLAFSGARTYHRMTCAVEDAGFEIRDQIMWLYGSGFPKSRNGEWGGTALKPAHEPIVVARKPLVGTVEANWRLHGTGALNIAGCRVGEGADGRWPANVMHDGSAEVVAAFPLAPGQIADASASASARKTQNVYGAMKRGRGDEPSSNSENDGPVGFKMRPGARRDDEGSAARFFYCAKASRADRNVGMENPGPQLKAGTTLRDVQVTPLEGNNHPTVKPTELMRWLCRLVTPPGGTVLDPFAGSGSTGRAASIEGFNAILMELNPAYIAIAQQRISGDAPMFDEVANA